MAFGDGLSPPPTKRRRLAESDSLISSILAPNNPSRPITDLGKKRLRIFTWNVNGIAPFLLWSVFAPRRRRRTPLPEAARTVRSPSLRTCLERWKWPQVVCLQELKIARGEVKMQEAVRQAVKAPASSREPRYTAHFSLPRDQYNARAFGGKLYGVCTLVREDLLVERNKLPKASFQPVPWDLEGRVLVLYLPKYMIAIFNVYAVNGTDTRYRDPKSGEVTGTRHDHKRAFHAGLSNACRELEEDGWLVVIAGDLNIARGPVDGFPGIRTAKVHVANRQDFEEKFMLEKDSGGLGMVDSFRRLHGEERKYSYRSCNKEWGSSCDRVDLILVSDGLARREAGLQEADILDEELERGPSDHLPLYVTLGLVDAYIT